MGPTCHSTNHIPHVTVINTCTWSVEQSGRQSADDISNSFSFLRIFDYICFKSPWSLFLNPTDNTSTLKRVMDRHQNGAKPSPELKMRQFTYAYIYTARSQWVKTLWQHSFGSILGQIVACCLTAPIHYLNHCWLIIRLVQWHSSEGKFAGDTSTITEITLNNTCIKCHSNLPRVPPLKFGNG